MIDPVTDIARKLRRDARSRRLAERHWAGWKLALTFGPYERALPARDVAAAKDVVRQALGPERVAAETAAASAEAQRDLWHLSASWWGSHPAEEGRRLLAELVVALGVPEGARAGKQPIRVFEPGGRPSPQVTHWTWKDAP